MQFIYVDLNEIYSFVVDDFSFEIIYGSKVKLKFLYFWNYFFMNLNG